MSATTSATAQDDYDYTFAHSAEGVLLSEALAEHVMEQVIETVEAACLDTTITALSLLAEILAGLEVNAGVTAEQAVREIAHLTCERLQRIRAESESTGSRPDLMAVPAASSAVH